MIILGIDPGLARIGFGVIKTTQRRKKQRKPKVLDWGVIETSKELDNSKRILILEKKIKKLLREYNPDYVVIEKLFFFKNLKTAIEVSQATGIIKLMIVKRKIPVFEITPLQVKMAITGYGQADKTQIQKLLQKYLELKKIPQPDDAADALALAYCGLILKKKNDFDLNLEESKRFD